LVFFAPRRGIFVSEISITDLQKIFEARMVLEGFCARLAAQRATAEQLATMDNIVRGLEHVEGQEARALMAVDEAFHEWLYDAADNKFVADTLRRLHALSFR
jgi:DNA-binding GntR family transcriptional regulator